MKRLFIIFGAALFFLISTSTTVAIFIICSLVPRLYCKTPEIHQ